MQSLSISLLYQAASCLDSLKNYCGMWVLDTSAGQTKTDTQHYSRGRFHQLFPAVQMARQGQALNEEWILSYPHLV
jgi:hypothetical protein